ncbi:HD domain-containing protein [Chamaesiphon minutus]|uniref:HD domain-containing protein n=1 Tax=Chamaesiphon minutus (strain ATCC 27169 / PCC 6605) TaxID=1173020 RepID=K9UMY4_CHAP6|nr:HD domain-containing protein [Chamaesiphon minutus]AFY96033.1 HD domain-containing protein [Chamaesiphon minutus PCC 6605]
MAQQFKTFRSVSDAYRFIADLGAPDRLIQHVKLVGEAADILILHFLQLDLEFDLDWIRLGVAFHDVGKILHPSELVEKGNRHEATGEQLLLSNNIDPKIARCCRSHAQWQQMECDFEELVVALADNLWKGKRNTELEERVIARVAQILNQDYWAVFAGLDDKFEQIAATGDRRLARSI